MKLFQDPTIGTRLEQAELLLRKIRLVQRTAIILAAAALMALVLGVLAVIGCIWSSWLFAVLVALAVGILTLAGMLTCVTALLAPISPDVTVTAVERSQPNLLDRLYTLLHLERTQPDSPWLNPITRQASAALESPSAQQPFSWRSALLHLAICAACILAAAIFYGTASPWKTLRDQEEMRKQSARAQKAYQELVIPVTAPPADQHSAASVRGEIRIARPGFDLRALPWEEIPLRIEAISPKVLQRAAWHSSVNGQPPTSHAIPLAANSMYIDWEVFIDLKDVSVTTWDVVAYYATTNPEDGNELVSAVYFIDVIPVSAELDTLPGGTTGRVALALEELNRLVASQQEAVKLVFDHNRQAPQVLEEWPAARRRLEHVQHLAGEMLAAWRAEAIDASLPNESAIVESLRQKWLEADQATQRAAQWAAATDSAEPDATQRQFPLQSPVLEAWQKIAELRKAYYEAALAHPELFATQTQAPVDEDPWSVPLSSELGEWREKVQQMGQRQERLLKADDEAAGGRDGTQPSSPKGTQAELLRDYEEWLCERRDVADRLTQAFDAAHRALEAAAAGEEAQGQADRRLQQRARDRLAELEHDLELLQHLKRHRELNDLARQLLELSAQLRHAAEQEKPIADTHADQLAQRVTQQYGKASSYAQESLPPGWALRDAVAEPGVCDAMQQGMQMAKQAESLRQASAQAAQQAAEKLAEAALRDARRASIDAHHFQLDRQLQDGNSQHVSDFDAARREVVQLLQRQRQIQRDFSSNRQQPNDLLSRQRNLADQFQAWREQHHELSRATSGQCDRVSDAMHQAAGAIGKDRSAASEHIQRAGDALQDLDLALENLQQHNLQILREQLGQMMQRHAKQFRQEATESDHFHPSQVPTACNLARQLGNRAAQSAPDPSAGGQFAQAVQEQSARFESSTSATQRRDAAEQLANLLERQGESFCSGGARSGSSRGAGQSRAGRSSSQAAAGGQSDGSSGSRGSQTHGSSQTPQNAGSSGTQGSQTAAEPQADSSQPGTMSGSSSAERPLSSNPALADRPRYDLARAFRLLEMLAREQAGRQRLTDSQRQAVRQEAVRALESSLPSLFGHNDRSIRWLEQVRRRLLEDVAPVDMQTVHDLMRDIDSLSRERVTMNPARSEQSSSMTIDPSRFPPQYRRAIGRYFEKLAEQRQP